nr:PREDICTED: vacuolar protein sorting-associated protein 13D isoform X1 [Bemisia tabaci]
MLEGLVAWVLNNYLGKYVENLNTDQLSVGLLRGAVELENLPLKKDALRELGLPVEVRSGFIGKVKLQVPVSQFRSAPWVILIENLYLTVGPILIEKWDEVAQERTMQEWKMGLLADMEARWRAELSGNQTGGYYASSYSSWLGYATGVMANIVDNLQLKIIDVHLRFEDEVTSDSQSFAVGVTIESLAAQSCNKEWIPGFVSYTSDSSNGHSFKLVELTNLAIYWDIIRPPKLLWSHTSASDLSKLLSCAAADKNDHQYILPPVCAVAHLKRNRSDKPLRSKTHPRIVCDLQLEEVALTLSDLQYSLAVNCVKGLKRIQLRQNYRKFRPTSSVKENPRAWWLYLFNCFHYKIKNTSRETASWQHCIQRAKENVAYVDIYSKVLLSQTASPTLLPEENRIKDTVEIERGLEELVSLREIAMFRVRPPQPTSPPVTNGGATAQGRSMLLSWFPQWWGWYSATQPIEGDLSSGTKDTGQLDDEIFDAIADTMENNTLLKRDAVFGQFNFTLKQGGISLCSVYRSSNGAFESRCTMRLQFSNMSIGYESRPRTGSHKISGALGTVSLHDLLTENSAFPVLISPQSSNEAPSSRPSRTLSSSLARLIGQESQPDPQPTNLFQFSYEYKPFHSNVDYKLAVQSQSLDIVYNPSATKWLIDFFTKPHQTHSSQLRQAARHGYNAMKQRTRKELLKNWENILRGSVVETHRKQWDIELNISAPQIFLVEHFTDKNAVLCVVDFGKLLFTNKTIASSSVVADNQSSMKEDEEEEEDEFQTPCSTPPGSETSEMDSVSFNATSNSDFISELSFHQKLYNSYSLHLCDLQILVGHVKDNWKHAHVKGASTLHVLDRFNISLQIERRVIFTIDPQFPSLVLTGSLPKLVVHINEQKIQAMRTLLSILSGAGLPSPFRSPDTPSDLGVKELDSEPVEDTSALPNAEPMESDQYAQLQFTVNQMSLELQSRGRAVAEVQVCRVRAACCQKLSNTHVSLSVHSLLVVDALQTFGPDFELLAASHKHVGMDSVSGSLRDSDPTSPSSPSSPDPLGGKLTSPAILSHALSTLSQDSSPSPQIQFRVSSPIAPFPTTQTPVMAAQDTEALISVDLLFESSQDPSGGHLKKANIQFNNLDIIANQETIVELIGFAKRILPPSKPSHNSHHYFNAANVMTASVETLEFFEPDYFIRPRTQSTGNKPMPKAVKSTIQTELTFNFHRLNVLLMRAVVKDSIVIGRKIATATLSGAKIQAVVGNDLVVEGSLGGLQVLDLTPEGQTHQRIISFGRDPLTEPENTDLFSFLSSDLYSMANSQSDKKQETGAIQALSFKIKRPLLEQSNSKSQQDFADVFVKLASVWYTHSPHFICELRSCATEFKQYLTNLARHIASSATEMAMGLVHSRADSLAQSLSMSSKLSLYGSSFDVLASPQKRRRSISQSSDSPSIICEEETPNINIRLDIIMDSPVCVLPRSTSSHEVLVAHLGRISVTNSQPFYGETPCTWKEELDLWAHNKEKYLVEIRDMNLHSLDIQPRILSSTNRNQSSSHLSLSESHLLPAAKLYNCLADSKPVLHDTAIDLHIEREVGRSIMKQSLEDSILLDGVDFNVEKLDTLSISGSVITSLKVSLARQQYLQLLDTANYLLTADYRPSPSLITAPNTKLDNIEEERSALSTLELDPSLRHRMLSHLTVNHVDSANKQFLTLNVAFDLPVFSMELKADLGSGEQGLVDLSFQNLSVSYDRSLPHETNLQVSLRSFVMEDLSQEQDSKHRFIVQSLNSSQSKSLEIPSCTYLSTSCPNLLPHQLSKMQTQTFCGSLPDHLHTEMILGAPRQSTLPTGISIRPTKPSRQDPSEYPSTPPPSPRNKSSPPLFPEENLVSINVLMYDEEASQRKANNVYKKTAVDFNSLDVIVNVESWVVVLDFFGISSPDVEPRPVADPKKINLNARMNQPSVNLEQTKIDDQRAIKEEEKAELTVSICSLSLILNKTEYEIARANVSNLQAVVLSSQSATIVEGTVNSLNLYDLTSHRGLYSNRFITSDLNIHLFRYSDRSLRHLREFDTHLKLVMSSVVYVHSQRFVTELQAYFAHFNRLQRVLGSIRSSTKIQGDPVGSRISLEISAKTPVALVPVSSRKPDLLIADLGKLTVNNTFKWCGDIGTLSYLKLDQFEENERCLLDVSQIELLNMDLYAGSLLSCGFVASVSNSSCVLFGGYLIEKKGPSLLQEKCELKLQVERNLMSSVTKIVPDLSIRGNITTLAIRLDVPQYRLVRGLLTYNIGENVAEIYQTIPVQDDEASAHDQVWTTQSILLDLVDVSITLLSDYSETDIVQPIACINFIKSKLTVESFSDLSQDIDLLSQEILVIDSRFQSGAVKPANVFTNILQPIEKENFSNVQAVVHHRKRLNSSKTTVLLNNMRVMLILDWWETMRDFIMQTIDYSSELDAFYDSAATSGNQLNGPAAVEMKINITDSEIVVVENTSQWDTNAVILKSTTVINYRPAVYEKPLSCNINQCEVFSCILGMEEETALSIIDPVTVNCEIVTKHSLPGDAVRVLKVQMHHLSIRLSYHDGLMFMQILKSIPKQTLRARTNSNSPKKTNKQQQIGKLASLGFSLADCAVALEKCEDLDEAALWLTQNSTPVVSSFSRTADFDSHMNPSGLHFDRVELKTEQLSICIIDDCRDADVPLIEISLCNLFLKQGITGKFGEIYCSLNCDYYNRVLSGWEPFIESWLCEIKWQYYSKTGTSLRNERLELNILSQEVLNVNITSTFIELYSSVKENWYQEYNSNQNTLDDSDKAASPVSYRRRAPFIPFALKNQTGSKLWYTPILANTDSDWNLETSPELQALEENRSWLCVEPGATVPFSFEMRAKVRHRNSHRLCAHRLGVRVDGWRPVQPVSVDQVGIYFRQAVPVTISSNLPPTRIVFEVSLEGSARKLITIRSALLIQNKLEESIEVKLENSPSMSIGADTSHITVMEPNSCEAVPLTHTLAQITLRPLRMTNVPSSQYHTFSSRPIAWQHVQKPGEIIEEIRHCHINKGPSYKFCTAVYRENYPCDVIKPLSPPVMNLWAQPAHIITILSPIIIVNLLPYELHYIIPDVALGRIKPGQKAFLNEIDPLESSAEISFHLENFPSAGTVIIPASPSSFVGKLRLHDNFGRKLQLKATVNVKKGEGIQVLVSAAYWIMNKTGLPIVFKQEGVSIETAGQSEEHEFARMMAPLLFSLADNEASPTVVARIGSRVHSETSPVWCTPFYLQPGVAVRRLTMSHADNRPDIVYVVGIEIRVGRGLYRETNMVTLSAHFQVHNKSSYHLQLAQKCLATALVNPGTQGSYSEAMPSSSTPFHWPLLDKEPLMCVRIVDVPNCMWSGGFHIDRNDSFHINIRDISGKMYFLRTEVVLQKASYFIIFMDASTLPPPLRIDNFSLVSLQFYQTNINSASTVRANSSIPYAWDEPMYPKVLTLVAPGGVSADFKMNEVGSTNGLTYENFIYIAFTGTFSRVPQSNSIFDPLDVQCQQLVLDVPDNSDRVILNRKQQGARSQLWRMTAEGQLQHEGSSPPRDPSGKMPSPVSDNVMVLDISGPAPQPTEYSGLVLRRPHQRRKMTQTWRFTEEGRLCCAHNNMCVQAKDGFFGLRPDSSGQFWQKWSEAVLGPPQAVCHQRTPEGVPLEQAVSRQRLRPGSGFLSGCVTTDGPTIVLQISDIHEKQDYASMEDKDWVQIAVSQRPTSLSHNSNLTPTSNFKEMMLNIDLRSGMGISVISRKPCEELLFSRLTGIHLVMKRANNCESTILRIQNLQVDNQLFEAQCPTVLYVTPNGRSSLPEETNSPILRLQIDKCLPKPGSQNNTEIIQSCILEIKKFSVILEEQLVLKMFAFAGLGPNDHECENTCENDYETQRILTEVTSVNAKRYYFGVLQLVLGRVRLSVTTSSKLSTNLKAIKRKLGLTLIKFEDAAVEIRPFIRTHIFETSQFLFQLLLKHFRDELKWQAAIILGSVDFLGNPIGFFSDVSEGFSNLIYDASVGSFFRNLTHAASNSAAKFTGSLSDGLGRVTLDEEHEETRRRIRKLHSGTSQGHLAAGLKGFGYGLIGGATSIVKQTYDGTANDGVQGFLSGLGKGLVGTITKPVVGVLDLVSETSSAIRDSSRSSSKAIPKRVRPPRCAVGPAGLLPVYSKHQSQGQQYLYTINEHDYSELFMAYEILRPGSEDLRIVISTQMIRIFTVNASNTPSVVTKINLNHILHCQPLILQGMEGNWMYYIELKLHSDSTVRYFEEDPVKKPRIRCETKDIAFWVSEQINYARNVYMERHMTLSSTADDMPGD